MKRYALIVAGGRGTRMKSDLPKQFMLLLDTPVLMHTIERFAFSSEEIEIVLVLPSDQITFWESLCKQLDFDIDHTLVAGGESRFESVKNGLAFCKGEGVVAIHDGVRPLVSESLIQQGIEAARVHKSALPVIPISQSIRRRDGDESTVVNRNGLVAVQTPQCFDLVMIQRAYDRQFEDSFTDDATVFEAAGNKIHLIDGEETNLKITTASDLKIAEAILSMSQSQ